MGNVIQLKFYSVFTKDVLADGERGFGLPEGEEYMFSMLPLLCADHGRRCLGGKKTKQQQDLDLNFKNKDFETNTELH